MKTQFTIFYSWQSDIKENRNRIESCIEKAIKYIAKEKQDFIQLELNIDRDTANQSGSPEIANTIFNKISLSDIFICDITLINNSLWNRIRQNRLTPNPNVIMELGFALKTLGWERIICVNNTKYGSTELLPFDIRSHRVSSYNSSDNEFKDKLSRLFTTAISSIIEDYSEIEKRYKEDNYKTHDRVIFDQIFKICNETDLKDSISSAVNSLFSNDYYYDKWDNVIHYYDETMNHFLDAEVDNLFRAFLGNLDNFRMLCYQKFHSDEISRKKPTLIDYEEAGTEITEELKFEILQSYVYRANKEPFPSEDYPDADKRIKVLQDELYELGKKATTAYHNFILAAKKNILIHT